MRAVNSYNKTRLGAHTKRPVFANSNISTEMAVKTQPDQSQRTQNSEPRTHSPKRSDPIRNPERSSCVEFSFVFCSVIKCDILSRSRCSGHNLSTLELWDTGVPYTEKKVIKTE